MGEFLLGVDGGGATTQAVIADSSGKPLGRGLGPLCNHRRVGFEHATQAIATAVEGALRQILGFQAIGQGAARGQITAACFGLAGIDRPEDESKLAAWVRGQGYTSVFAVMNDSDMILRGGTAEGWGIALVSGTGSICVGRSKDGRSARVGGWGHILGDEGSSYAIATEALHLATQTADGRAEARAILRAVLAHWSLKSPDDLINYVYRAEITQDVIASVAGPVLDLAARGDLAARRIADEAGAALARHVDTVMRKLSLDRPPLAMAGSTLRASLRTSIVSQLGAEVGPVSAVQDPALAGVAVARRLLEPATRVRTG
jgi:N-acetylglucosamine kinase-like BadF-type ATPase